ncbi:hypothetical protein [Streptomyces sp. NPDC002232]|uniref:hypothetical protein n=1 Tax=Streptomyces sp. NPDC002232 TaxID=3364640 RepID=UPI00368F199A
MRTALRTAVATALVAGVALTTPALAAGAAFAAAGPVAAHPVLPGTVKVAGPGTGSPKAGTVEVEGPSTGAPKAEAPKTEVPKPEVPDTEAPKTEAPKTKAPKTEAPDDAPAPGPVVTVGECSVRQDVPSVFALMTVTLTRDLEKGPKAVLKDEAGKPVATVDRAHPADTGMGLTLKGADTVTPQLGQRTQGGDTPYAWTAFPKLPKGCEKDATPTPAPSVTTPASSGGTGITVNNGGQTSVVPKGGVAAGAEFAAEGDSTALIAVGAGAASLAAAGLGFVVLRRRAAGRV